MILLKPNSGPAPLLSNGLHLTARKAHTRLNILSDRLPFTAARPPSCLTSRLVQPVPLPGILPLPPFGRVLRSRLGGLRAQGPAPRLLVALLTVVRAQRRTQGQAAFTGLALQPRLRLRSVTWINGFWILYPISDLFH